MFPRRDPDLLSQYLCRFCAERIAWGVILPVLRVDPRHVGLILPARGEGGPHEVRWSGVAAITAA